MATIKSIEEKAKAYDEVVSKLKGFMMQGVDHLITRNDVQDFFPELRESKDERIRKTIYNCVKWFGFDSLFFKDVSQKECLAWLEKQGEQKPAECRQETKPNGGIVSEDFNDGDGYYKVNLAYLSKSQVERIESLVASWQNPTNNTASWSEEDEETLNTIINHFKVDIECTDEDDIVRWLKSLKERYTWKPSEEQIQALEYQVHSTFEGYWQYKASKELLEQLKKL